eukprot:scpid69681/ scgid9895/ 
MDFVCPRRSFAMPSVSGTGGHQHACHQDASVATVTLTSPMPCPAVLGASPVFATTRSGTSRLMFCAQVMHGVCTEPMLQPVTGEKFRLLSTTTADQARLDVAANGIWGGRFERTFLDIRVFNPYAASNRAASVSSVYARHEKEKRRRYEQRLLEVDRATFVPVVLSATGGTSKCASPALFKEEIRQIGVRLWVTN